MNHELTSQAYGKSRVRLTKVVRKTPVHQLFEFDVAVELIGDFAPAYADGNNQNVIATDTIKNTIYVLAKEHDFSSVEQFSQILSRHFLATYPQVQSASAIITQSAWTRIIVDGKPHDHAFSNGGTQLRYSKSTATRTSTSLIGGVRHLLVLKTTASEWADFHRDRYRTLKDSHDRLIATRIDADWTFNAKAAGNDFDAHNLAITNSILTTFARHYSLGVQQTLLAMGNAALDACDAIDDIAFELPNMHRIPFNLEPFGLAFENDVFIATEEPFGLIKGKVTRKK